MLALAVSMVLGIIIGIELLFVNYSDLVIIRNRIFYVYKYNLFLSCKIYKKENNMRFTYQFNMVSAARS